MISTFKEWQEREMLWFFLVWFGLDWIYFLLCIVFIAGVYFFPFSMYFLSVLQLYFRVVGAACQHLPEFCSQKYFRHTGI